MGNSNFSIQIILIAIAIALLPLASFLITILFKKVLSQKKVGYIASILQALAFLSTIYIFQETLKANTAFETNLEWFRIGPNIFAIHFLIDGTSAFMFFIVNLISLLVHIFSLEYMKDDKNIDKYFAYLGLFTFSMLGILLTANIMVIYIFWELVGLSSYLLIGFWHDKPKARSAAKKAFILNRVGDAGFLIGIISLFALFSTLDLTTISLTFDSQVKEENYNLLLLAGFGIFCGAIGKSAQLPLSSWLPDAMEGPTPVSALIHAATMVAAGVYLLFRCAFLFLPEINLFIAIIGTTTAFVAAVTALSQTDIKKVLAYSTISQLGYMVSAVGVGAEESGMFHLFTHAFFKAGLFLSAGAVIHTLHLSAHKSNLHIDAQDMRTMGNLFKKMPVVAICFGICASALAGLPFFSGFLSKDAILLSMWNFAAENGATSGNTFYWLIPFFGLFTALLTAFYSFRQVLLVFGGKDGWRGKIEIWESIPKPNFKIKLPLLVLSSLSIFIIFALNPFNAEASWVFSKVLSPNTTEHSAHFIVVTFSAVLAITGVATAWLVYQTKTLRLNHIIADNSFAFKLTNKFWFIDDFLVNPTKRLLLLSSQKLAVSDTKVINAIVDGFAILQVVFAHVLAWLDKNIVDGFISLLTKFTRLLGNILRKSPGQQVQSYVSWAVFTTLIIVLLAVLYLEI